MMYQTVIAPASKLVTFNTFSSGRLINRQELAMRRSNCRSVCSCYALLTIAALVSTALRESSGQDLLNDNPTLSDFSLELRPYVQMPVGSSNVISMTTRLGDQRLYVTTQEGKIHTITPNVDGTGTAATWFDIATTGVSLFGTGGQSGLQSTAFHPDFDNPGAPGYGKFYATMLRSAASGPGAFYLGDSPRGASVVSDGVLAEWSYDHDIGTFGGFRELLRVKMPVNEHPIKQAKFNPYAEPGDEDYGLLYVAHGDSNLQHSPASYPQLLGNALGKLIRIDPLAPDGTSGAAYSVPTSNPFASSADPSVLPEIYAYGFRNPHTFSFNRDGAGATHILVGNIGRANVEEIELVLPGENYGWPKREGIFVERQIANDDPVDPGAGYISGIQSLPENEADFGYSFPVAQYDHNALVSQVSSGNAVASGFVIRNGSDPNLDNQLIFNNFANKDGAVYHADFADMLAAVAKLNPNDASRDEPNELTQAPLRRLQLALDHDNNSATGAQVFQDLSTLLSGLPESPTDRNDARYGEGVYGEMYISTKQQGGRIYLVTNSIPLAGDYNHDRVVDAADYTIWRDTMGEVGYHLGADGNGNATVDLTDYDVWKNNFGTIWNCSGPASHCDVDSGNAAFEGSDSQSDPGANTNGESHSAGSVPEPSQSALAGIALLGLSCIRPNRHC
jgi:glucose/arabinose dehydrogenase